MNKRRLLFTSGLVAILVFIAIICFIVGRGHNVYFDNKSIDGTAYESYAFIDLYYKGEKVTTLGKAERAAITLTGQKITVDVKYQKKRSSKEETKVLEFDIPYNMDGMVINLPALLDGAKEDVYMSEFVPIIVEETEEEVPNTDEFAITTEEE